MTPQERADIEALAGQVCPHTKYGLPCERDDHTDDRENERHWASGPHGQGVNWPSELSDQAVKDIAS